MVFPFHTCILQFLFNLVIFAGSMIQVSIILHVVGIASTVSENGSWDTSFSFNVVVATHLTDKFPPASNTDKVTGS